MENNIKIDRETYKISSDSYIMETNQKKQIIIGATNRADSNHLIRLKNQKVPMGQKWSTYTITRTGIIYEHFNPIYYSRLIGTEVVDRKSISIMLENMGPLYYRYETDRMYNFLNEVFNGTEDEAFERVWRNYRYYENFTEEQYKSLLGLCRTLCHDHGIEFDTYGHNVLESDAPTFNGIITRSNLNLDYNDPNPSLDMGRFLKELKIY